VLGRRASRLAAGSFYQSGERRRQRANEFGPISLDRADVEARVDRNRAKTRMTWSVRTYLGNRDGSQCPASKP
jgi:hypothetical protein